MPHYDWGHKFSYNTYIIIFSLIILSLAILMNEYEKNNNIINDCNMHISETPQYGNYVSISAITKTIYGNYKKINCGNYLLQNGKYVKYNNIFLYLGDVIHEEKIVDKNANSIYVLTYYNV